MTHVRLSRIFWRGAAAILLAAALVALGSVLKGNFSSTDGRILGTLALFLYTGGALSRASVSSSAVGAGCSARRSSSRHPSR